MLALSSTKLRYFQLEVISMAKLVSLLIELKEEKAGTNCNGISVALRAVR